MDKKKLKDFREKLIAKRTELTEGFARSKSEATEATQESAGGGTEDFVDYAVSKLGKYKG